MRLAAIALCTSLALSGAVTASGAEAPSAQKAVQPKVGSKWTGSAPNGGQVLLKVSGRYDSGLSKTYRIPQLKWTRVKATCQRWNGSAFVEGVERITVRFEPTTYDGRIRNGKFKWDYYYAGQHIAHFKGTFKRHSVRGEAEMLEYHFTDPAKDQRSCTWGPLDFDLARSDIGHD